MYKLTRHSSNPILTPTLPWEEAGVFNPGIVKTDSGIVMLYRAVGERHSYTSHFGLAKSTDGISFERASSVPVFGPHQTFDAWATEDPRVVAIDGEFYVTYVAVPSRVMYDGAPSPTPIVTSIALLKTRDFITYENLGIISPEGSDNKDLVLFPKKIGGRYAMLHRPYHWTRSWQERMLAEKKEDVVSHFPLHLPNLPAIWISFSTDLKNWSDQYSLIWPTHEADARIGPGLPPLETPEGWLVIYHHVERGEGGKVVYAARAALLKLEDPRVCIGKLSYNILEPEEWYERESVWDTVSGVVFPSGGYIDGDTLFIYYGASDRYIGLATGSLSELLTELKNSSPSKK